MDSKWIDCGAGAYQTECRRFYMQVVRTYLGSVARRGTYDRTVRLLDRSTNSTKEFATITEAKKYVKEIQ